jgi:hypothetical protein
MSTLSKEPGSMAAELEWSQPIPAETARRLACDAAITPIIDGEADRTSRVVPGATRRALIARDKGCRFPGCDCPPAWTDAHDIKHWADGGATTLENPILLCAASITGWCMKRLDAGAGSGSRAGRDPALTPWAVIANLSR